jgi:hypothetical protein
MKVSFLHNTTEVNGRLAIFAHFGDEPRAKPGDELQLVGAIDFPDVTDPQQAAELAFEAGNSPYESEAVKEYRSWEVRSLSVGDVVTVENDDLAVENDDFKTVAFGCEPTGWIPVDITQFELSGAVILNLYIENRYELYGRIDTKVTGVVVPAPPADEESVEYDDWAYDNINCYTGTGHTKGDSWYDVKVTASSDPALVGRTFEWGY